MTEEQCRMDDFARDLSELGVVLSEKQYGQFCQYYNLLLEWNKVMNLTSITNFDDVVKYDLEYIDNYRDPWLRHTISVRLSRGWMWDRGRDFRDLH